MSVVGLAADLVVRGVMAASDEAVEPEAYLACIAAGATHSEVMLVVRGNVALLGYGAVRRCGASHSEALCVLRRGIEPEEYSRARKAGASHREVLSVVGPTGQWLLDCWGYCDGLEAGIAHRELIEACGTGGFWIEDYIDSRIAGASHAEMLEILNWSEADRDAYRHGRYDLKIPHGELCEAQGVVGEDKLSKYVQVRKLNTAHDEALSVWVK